MLLLKNANLYDPANERYGRYDIVITHGIITKLAPSTDSTQHDNTLDCSDYIIAPGLIDLHTHIYWGATALGVSSQQIFQQSAINTLVDAGSSGAGNFHGFYDYIVKPAAGNIFAFLNISYAGIFGFSQHVMVGECTIPELLNIDAAAAVCARYPHVIRGIKVRACQAAAGQYGLQALEHAVKLADKVNLPVMSHIGTPPPNYDAVLAKLRSGDIITHAFRPAPNSALNEDNTILPAVIEARKRGILFDIGHGMGGFSFDVARQMIAQGFYPDTISSDLHQLCIQGPCHDLLTTMNKCYHLGMPLKDVIRATTETPANILQQPELGSIAVGQAANLSILQLTAGEFDLCDASGQQLIAKQILTPIARIFRHHYCLVSTDAASHCSTI